MERPDVTEQHLPAPSGVRRAAHLAFMSGFAVLGWGALLAATYLPGLGLGEPRHAGILPLATFFAVIVAARRMAMPMLPRVVVSLDTGFYVAAALCLGSTHAGRIVAVALTLDTLIRLFERESVLRRARDGSWLEDLIYVLYFGGMTGALVMWISWGFNVDRFYPSMQADAELIALRLVFTIGVTFLVAHYALQGVRMWLVGRQVRSYVRRMAWPGILAEVSLLPLAVVVVLIYRPQRPLGFLLLGATYLLINLVFSRLRRTSAALQSRVKELETLNATSRELAASLQLHELVESVAHETARAIPDAELLTLVHRARSREGGAEQLIVDSFDRERGAFERFHVSEGQGPTGWVLEHHEPLNIKDLAGSGFDAGTDSGVRSWLGVPLVIHGETSGVLAVQSRHRGAFDANQQRLLEAIGAQAAVALQNARLYELAMVDGLTRLFVRRYFDARLGEEVERSKRFDTEFSVVMMDIDDFKLLNDTHGHQAGDAVLRGVADIVRHQMRGVDTAARYGGEEFSMVLPRTGMLDAYNQAERIRQRIEELRVHIGGDTVGVSASFGIASFPESGADDSAELIRLADTALYRAKKTGKNRVELYWAEGAEGSRPSMRTV
jgi:diguanylate cyclase (GGDEF)-like protein